MKSKTTTILSLFLLLSTSQLIAQTVSPDGSVSTPLIVAPNGTSPETSFTRDGYCSAGFAWSEATLWDPDGGDTVLGNEYVTPYSQDVFVGAGYGVYWIQYRLVDVDYDYEDQWIEINANLCFDLDLRDDFEWILQFDAFSADSSLESLVVNYNGITYATAAGSSSSMDYYDGALDPTGYTLTLVAVDSSGTHTIPLAYPFHYGS
jgi:hypothetical protein